MYVIDLYDSQYYMQSKKVRRVWYRLHWSISKFYSSAQAAEDKDLATLSHGTMTSGCGCGAEDMFGS